MRIASLIFWIVIGLLIVIFAALNSYTVTLHYYINTINIYFPLLLFISVAIGVLLGILVMLPSLFKERAVNRKLRAELAAKAKDERIIQ